MDQLQANRRAGRSGDRRRFQRGGRRAGDRPGKNPALLLAESQPELRSLFARYLGLLNFQVEAASTAADVLSALGRNRPAAVLIDSTLPGLPAWQLGVWMAADRRAPRTPIIVLDGTDGDELRVDPEFRPQEVLQKPFPLSVMTDGIRRALRACPPP